MTLRVKAVAAGILMTALASSAACSQSFGGFHVGISGGGAFGSQSQTGGVYLPPTSSPPPVDTDGSYRIGGAALGGGLGYDWQFGKALLGLEADFSWIGARGNVLCSVPFPSAHGCGGGLTSLGTVRGKLGYEIGSIGVPLLAYVTGGLAFGGIRGWDNLLGGSGATTAAGWTIGGGLEALVAPNWSVKLEYLYADLGNRGTFYATPLNIERLRTTTSVVRLGLNYRFSIAPPAAIVAKY